MSHKQQNLLGLLPTHFALQNVGRTELLGLSLTTPGGALACV